MSTPTPDRTQWRKSSYSGANEGNCVEVADLNDQVAIRDSKAPETGHLALTRESFAALLSHLGGQT
ncbi:DUF397 domain-containing protein [Actinomadura madurae]|uniref:DUF397 domain-containing protein n=1 Tax=Actinomadura madurae TaxID=1993 RepID=A0A1I4Z2M2_9ACTN|nr:DUF397 domain-containing protein [Actinomadura madurae]SFN44140.1 protein of unknown function [Actinomadura madurae]SPT49647.1 Domain of uncharacterised function (DUF397) [Actinomadura madurae]